MTILRLSFFGGPLDGQWREFEYDIIERGIFEVLSPRHTSHTSNYMEEGGKLTEDFGTIKHMYTLEKAGEHFFLLYKGEE